MKISELRQIIKEEIKTLIKESEVIPAKKFITSMQVKARKALKGNNAEKELQKLLDSLRDVNLKNWKNLSDRQQDFMFDYFINKIGSVGSGSITARTKNRD